MRVNYVKWFADLMRGIGIVTVILRVAISPQFLYNCSENVTVANVAFDVGAYITLAASALPWYEFLPWTKQTDKVFFPHVYVYAVLLGLSVVYVVLMVLRWYVGLGSLHGCSGCPTVSQSNFTQDNVECTATSSDFFYNGLNYCSDVFATLCYPVPAASKSDLKGLDSSVAHCPLLGCNVQLLPLQFVSYWWTVAAFGVNIALCAIGFTQTDKLKKAAQPDAEPPMAQPDAEPPTAETVEQPNPSAPQIPIGGVVTPSDEETDVPMADKPLPRVKLFEPLPRSGTHLQLPRRRFKVRPLPV